MTKTISTYIVGSHFRPPAKQLLTVIPIGSELQLVPEPENPYDPHAIKVLVSLRETYPIARWVQLDEALEGTGWTSRQIMEQESISGPTHLGYLPQSGGKAARGGPGNREVINAIAGPDGDRTFNASLSTAPDGSPAVIITINESEEPT